MKGTKNDNRATAADSTKEAFYCYDILCRDEDDDLDEEKKLMSNYLPLVKEFEEEEGEEEKGEGEGKGMFRVWRYTPKGQATDGVLGSSVNFEEKCGV